MLGNWLARVFPAGLLRSAPGSGNLIVSALRAAFLVVGENGSSHVAFRRHSMGHRPLEYAKRFP